jgi:hypothetical protein
MSSVSQGIVREYFELQEFLVLQVRKYIAPAVREDEEVDFLILNPNPGPPAESLPFVLGPDEVRHVRRAVVVIKAWHTEVFSPAFLTNTPEIFRFMEKKSYQRALKSFAQADALLKILVVSALPEDPAARKESTQILRNKGVDAVISFQTMLAELVRRVQPNRNYENSDLLQTLRVLKNYDFLKDPQLELFKPKRRLKRV